MKGKVWEKCGDGRVKRLVSVGWLRAGVVFCGCGGSSPGCCRCARARWPASLQAALRSSVRVQPATVQCPALGQSTAMRWEAAVHQLGGQAGRGGAAVVPQAAGGGVTWFQEV